MQCHSGWYTLANMWPKTDYKQTLLKVSITHKTQTTQSAENIRGLVVSYDTRPGTTVG